MTWWKRRMETIGGTSFDETVLADPRWDALASGGATPEEVAELRAWADQSEAAKAVWNMFQPVGEERIDGFVNGVLRELGVRDKTASIRNSQPSATSAPTESMLKGRDEKLRVRDKKAQVERLSKKTISIYLIANDVRLRINLVRALRTETGMTVVGAGCSIIHTRSDVHTYKPDVVLVDLNALEHRKLRVPRREVGATMLFAELRVLRREVGAAKLFAFRGNGDDVHGTEAPSGAQEPRFQISEVVNFTNGIPQLLRDETPLGQHIAGAVANATRESAPEWTKVLDALTPDELEVLELLILGKSMAEIVGKSPVKAMQIKPHVQSIYRKLGCRSETELARVAMGIESNKRE